jgi:hypothetical protein
MGYAGEKAIGVIQMDKHSEKQRKKFPIFVTLVLVLGVFAFAPKIFSNCMGPEVVKDFMGTWGEYVGAFLGVLATLIAFYWTYTQNLEQNAEIQEQNAIAIKQNELIQKQNDDAAKRAEEQMRLQALPFLNTCEKSPGAMQGKSIYFDNDGIVHRTFGLTDTVGIKLQNIGVAPAISVHIQSEYLGHISAGATNAVVALLPMGCPYIELYLTYQDREGRDYSQKVVISRDNDDLIVKEITLPVLV